MPTIGRLRYLDASPDASTSSGPVRGTLVLLHAFPLNARMWEGQLALADRGWRVVAPQLGGVDGGVGAPPAVSMDDYAGDVIDLFDALNIREAVIGGLSMGGYVAFALLRHAPRYFQGLILADTRSQADTPEGAAGRTRLLKMLEENGPSAVADEMLPKLIGETTRRLRPEVTERVRALVLSNSAAAIAGSIRALITRPDSTPLLASIHVPTLIIVGDEDTLTPVAQAEEMHRAIAGSELTAIAGAGHLTSLEQPAAFNDALARFLDHRL